MNERESVTIDSDGTIIIDDPELEFALHELAGHWNVSVERALTLALKQAWSAKALRSIRVPSLYLPASPAKAGAQLRPARYWTPAFAGEVR